MVAERRHRSGSEDHKRHEGSHPVVGDTMMSIRCCRLLQPVAVAAMPAKMAGGSCFPLSFVR